MAEQMWWKLLGFTELLNAFTIYFSILLGRCALLSFPILTLVMILRKTILKKQIFSKGLIWGIFLAVPFMGKLNLFYDNRWMWKFFMWWNDICMAHGCVRYGYLLCMLLYSGHLIRSYGKVWRQLGVMEKGSICGQSIFVSETAVTPFAAGLSVEEEHIYIDRKTMDSILYQYGVKETEFWLLFGGYSKLPGFGGKGNLVYVDYGGQESVLKISYENRDRFLSTMIFKMM